MFNLFFLLLVIDFGDCHQHANIPLRGLRTVSALRFRNVRRSVNSDVNKRDLIVKHKLQPVLDPKTPFFCPLNNTRSKTRPTSVHQLRPGDIDVIGAIGDSLSVGVGLTATKISQVYYPNRGLSPTAGGQSNWREFLTVANILKEFNPKLKGYAEEASLNTHKQAQFNVAQTGAMSMDVPHMTRLLVKRIKSHPYVNFEEDWKLISLMIGPNDFCLNICYQPDLNEVLEKHRRDLIKTLRILRDSIPRTFVMLVPAPNLKTLIEFTNRPVQCYLNQLLVCPCLIGERFKKFRPDFIELMTKWQNIELEVADLEEFDTDTFTVAVQPFTRNMGFPKTPDNMTDYTFLSEDCFHFSQKGNAMIANSLWNNLLQPVGRKQITETRLFDYFICPTEENPYIFTKRNSLSTYL
ncbi:phospholipase B1, membrane-associated isoform X2 [Aethina tumida]|uniref:phospholipase B1, membrane-associated isoform X2 n=1 Tax=Aethina tumida TaxID=116153 RepID=UPI002147DE6F|nr:phospholipase B1, membrane-associated isoform X2 [Aethina tumida]